MPRRRHSSSPSVPDRASDEKRGVGPISLRVGALEQVCADMKRMLDVQFQRIAAIQAQLDHISAKITGR